MDAKKGWKFEGWSKEDYELYKIYLARYYNELDGVSNGKLAEEIMKEPSDINTFVMDHQFRPHKVVREVRARFNGSFTDKQYIKLKSVLASYRAVRSLEKFKADRAEGKGVIDHPNYPNQPNRWL